MTSAKYELRASVIAAMAMSMSGGIIDDGLFYKGRKYHRQQPWDHIQLSKAERKGKTPEQLQALRQEKYATMAAVDKLIE